jgi:hypothetical protein
MVLAAREHTSTQGFAMNLKHLVAGGIVALGLTAASTGGLIGAVQAAPAPASAAVAAQTAIAPSVIDQVQYRRGFGYRPYAYRRGYGWRGPGVWLGLGAAVAAGWIIYDRAYLPRRGYYYDTYDYDGPYYYPTGYNGDRRELCARYFKSFEWESGMYTTYGGQRKLCPYLRD